MDVRHYSFPVPQAPCSGTANKNRAGTVLDVSKIAGQTQGGVWKTATRLVFEEQRAGEQTEDCRLLSSLFRERGSCQSRHLPEICVTDLVPDEDRSWDSDDLTAQVHLGTSDIPDVLGGRHNGRTYKRGHKAKWSF